MSEEKKQNVPVNIRDLEKHGIDLHEFKPGVTYPLAKLMDALGVFHVRGRPKLRPRGTTK
jgi:hypothetical protein